MQLVLERVWTKKDPRGSLRKKNKKTWIYTVSLIYAFQQPLNSKAKAFETLKKMWIQREIEIVENRLRKNFQIQNRKME